MHSKENSGYETRSQFIGYVLSYSAQQKRQKKKGLFRFNAKKITKTFIAAGHTTEKTTQLISKLPYV